MQTSSKVVKFRPIDDVESSLIEIWREVSKATHRFLVLLREFDLRLGWKSYGNADCAEWLNWKCGISRTTAQEKVRVARALWVLPKVEAAFARGDLSYSKVRALSRVATERNEAELLSYALGSSAAQVEAYCKRLRHGDAEVSAADARRLHEGRSLSRQFREDGSGILSVELPQADLELVLQALEHVGRTLPNDPSRSLFAKGADALLQMARDALAGHGNTGSVSDTHQIVVHVDAAALSGEGGQSDLPLPTVQRLCCDGAVIPMVDDANGHALNVGRKQRIVPPALQRAVFARDRGCTFPGCHHVRYHHYHHVEHWIDGGETSLDNVVVLCATHHRLVHEGGYRMLEHPHGGYYFVRPDGRPVEAAVPTADRIEAPRALYQISPSAEGGVGQRQAQRLVSSKNAHSAVVRLLAIGASSCLSTVDYVE